jgi:hypothetical protein
MILSIIFNIFILFLLSLINKIIQALQNITKKSLKFFTFFTYEKYKKIININFLFNMKQPFLFLYILKFIFYLKYNLINLYNQFWTKI